MKKKKGFTLVELLAVIVVLAIILVIAVPKILDVIKSSRENSLISSVKLVARQAEQKLLTNEVLGEDEELDCSKVADINTTDYDSCTIDINEETKEVTVTIKGKGKFSGYTCTGNKSNVTCEENSISNDEDDDPSIVTLKDVIMDLASESENQVAEYRYNNLWEYDDAGTHIEYRYYGTNDKKNPNNYVMFNDEIWRIVGVLNTKNQSNKDVSLVKIIKQDHIDIMVLDTTESNNWARPATLNTYLNTEYWNTLSTDAQDMVEQDALWYIAALPETLGVTNDMYKLEHGTEWNGTVALMSACDYGYAAIQNEVCSEANLGSYSECKNSNWLHSNIYGQWTLSASLAWTGSSWRIHPSGYVSASACYISENIIRPAVYLKSNVYVSNEDADGSIDHPYVLAID